MGSVKTFSRVSLVLKKSSMAAFSIPSTYMTTSTLLSTTAAVSSPHSSLDFLLFSMFAAAFLLLSVSTANLSQLSVSVAASWKALTPGLLYNGGLGRLHRQGSFAVCQLSSLTCSSENVEQRFSTI